MALVFDDRENLAGGPGLHALIVGVSSLPYCIGGTGPLAAETFGIGQVSGPAVSAYKLYEWIIENKQRFIVPLTTVRMLLSPLQEQRTNEPAFENIDGATLENFMREVHDWRDDASSQAKNITIFIYIAWGLGIGNDIALLLTDFGRPGYPLMSHTVSFDNIFSAMSPSFSTSTIANTQFYFVDAGRWFEPKMLPYVGSITRPFDLVPTHARDKRTAPIFYSSVAGGLPFSRVGGLTIFTEALLDCLKGKKAAEPTDEYRAGKRLWRVSVNSLNSALEKRFDELDNPQAKGSEKVTQYYALGGIVKDTTFCLFDQPPPMAALAFDTRDQSKDLPGFHVLIAGVSSYPHAKGGSAEPAKIDLGIRQLTAAASSAYEVYKWLLARRDRLPVPLASVRLLLSPVSDEKSRHPEMFKKGGDRCTLQNFLAAAAEWRDDAAKNPDSMTFFYFAGHGAQRTKGDSILILDDFGETTGGPLKNTVDVNNLFEGMAPSTTRKHIARTQLYFIDTCRVKPTAFKNYQFMHTTSVFEVEEIVKDNRYAPIFFAAIPGSVAYSVPQEQTAFSRALLESLERAAVRQTGPESCISVNSLDQALGENLRQWNRQNQADQEYTLGGMSKDKVLFKWSVDRSMHR